MSQLFMNQLPQMVAELPFAVTVCDTKGVVLYMNERSIATFQKYGGVDVIGTSLFLYHRGPSAEILQRLLDQADKHVYTIEKNGLKKIIYQSPWYENGNFAGLIELSLEIPFDMPHYVRG